MKNKKKKDDFVHLHTHSDMSQLDGCATIDAYTKAASKRGNPAIAITDHGTMRGYYEAHKRSEEHGIKPIYGIEFYVAKNMKRKGLTEEEKDEIGNGLKSTEKKIAIKEYEDKEGIRDRWHLTVWAKNDIGLKNLFKLSSESYTDGFYYKPRIDIDTLLKHGEGLAVGSGCLASVINDRVISGKRKQALETADRLFERFGSDLWLEIQPHPIPQQTVANKFALKLKKRFGGKVGLIATQDAHYVSKNDSVHHDVMLCVGTHSLLTDEKRFRFDGDGFFLKNRKQMRRSFLDFHDYLSKQTIKESLDNTMLFAEMVDAKVKVDFLAAILPEIEIEDGYKDDIDYFNALCFKGWVWREIENRIKKLAKRKGIKRKALLKIYKERLVYEMKIIKRQKFVPYFLVVYDIYKWVRENKIMCGPGRGSSAGSLVSYLLGITSVDPIEHDLLFERFMHPERCFPGDTLVKTKCGWKKIEDIKPYIDFVKTRKGYEIVLDRPVRKTNEKLLRIYYQCGDEEKFLTTTKNHVIFRCLNGKVEAKRANEIKVGQHFLFENSFLFDMRRKVYKNMLEQKNLFKTVFNKGSIKKEKNIYKNLSLLWKKRKNGERTKILLEKMWKVGESRQNKKPSQVWFQRRSWPLCQIFSRGGFCKVIEDKKNNIQVRARNIHTSRWDKIHTGFLGRRFWGVCRVEGLEKTVTKKNVEGKRVFWKKTEDLLLPSNCEINKKTRFRESSKFRTFKRQPIQSISDDKKKMSRMWYRLQHSNNKKEKIQNLQQILCEYRKIQKIASKKNKGKEKRTLFFRKQKEFDKKTEKKNLLFEGKYKNTREAIVTRIEEVSLGEIKVYDLCINKTHEYFANGILVKNSDLPDIDMDFEDSRRQEIIDYLRNKYGDEKVAQISTFGTLKGKQCLKDVSRVLNIPFKDVNEITSSILTRSDSHPRSNRTIIDSFKEFEVCKKFDNKYPEVVGHADALEGLTKSLGLHAAGVIVTPKPIVDYTPIELRKYKDKYVKVTALEKDGASAIGLVKLDVLGLKTLTVIRECLESIERRYGKEIDLERLDLYDQNVLDGFTNREFLGVFQFDTPGANKMCEGIVFDSFSDLPTLNALNRPGATQSGLAKEWVDKKKNPKKRKKSKFHKSVVEITSDTLGVITYQEHVNRIFIDVAGFEPGVAEKLRKKIGKSKGKEAIDEVKDDFVKGALKKHKKNGMTKEAAEKIIDAIGFFGKYGFNKSHSTAYAIIAYWTMYLKIYYPLDFYWSLLKNEEKDDKVQQIAKAIKRKGIKILPPNITSSKRNFAIDDKEENTIRGSLLDIKGVGEQAVKTIVNNQPYKSFYQFVKKIDRRKCHKGVVLSLLKAGALDDYVPNVKWLVENFDDFWKNIESKKLVSKSLKRSKKKVDYDKEERRILASTVNPFSFGEHPIIAYKNFLSEHIKVKIVNLGGDFYDKYNGKTPFVTGVIVDSKFNRIGDYHTGDLPNEKERKMKFWGFRYGNVNVESRDGEQRRIKFDIDVFEQVRSVIDNGAGTPVLIHCSNINASYTSIKGDFIINLEELRKKIKNGEELNLYERIVTGDHPALKYKWENKKIEKEMITHQKFLKNSVGGVFCGVVTHVMKKYDKNGNQMAFIGVHGVKKHIEVICFSSSWMKDRKKFEVGNLIKIAVEKQKQKGRGLSYIYNDGGVKVLK